MLDDKNKNRVAQVSPFILAVWMFRLTNLKPLVCADRIESDYETGLYGHIQASVRRKRALASRRRGTRHPVTISQRNIPIDDSSLEECGRSSFG